ncbi:MAG TPA: hypothetical protein VGA22_13795 [Gemmatimonadales bacterium]
MPADRFKTAAAFADALTNPAFTLPAAAATPDEEAMPARSRKRLLTGVSMVAARRA